MQSIGELAAKRFENQVDEHYYEQDILEKCGLPTAPSTPRAATPSTPSGNPSTPRGTGATAPATPRGGVGSSTVKTSSFGSQSTSTSNPEEVAKLPSLKVLNSDADLLREKNNIHSGYMKHTLAMLSPMLRILHVYRVMNQVPELAAFYNANRLVRYLPFAVWAV
jgi:hypothetical protein